MLPSRYRPLMFTAVILCAFIASTDALAVMSIDLGSEFMKVAIVKPGIPMDIALNAESKRKTPVVISLRDGERNFGDPAVNVATKFPKKAYQYFNSLLGKSPDSPQVQMFKERFPYYTLEVDEESQTLYFKHDEDTKFSTEELYAMMIEKAKEMAEAFAEQTVNDVVITVPPFFNQAERRAVIRAADIAGVKLLQLMNDNTATAFNYGIFRRKSFTSEPVNYMFYDVGATATTATVVSYALVKAKNPATGQQETNPQLTVKGVGYDSDLGGLQFQLRLRDHLVKAFNDQKKTTTDVRTNERAMAKLFKEAGRLMKVLSANTNQRAQIEGLLEDIDFKVAVTRDEFETMCADLFARITKPVLDVMKVSEFTWEEITEVILMGGATRIPKVQELLKKAIGREELGKSINTDESAAMGAVYQAAHLSKGFKVKTFLIKDTTLFPIQVEFERVQTADTSPDASKTVKRTLFGLNNPYPQKKVMTFNKHITDFSFEVNYGDLAHLSEDQQRDLGVTKLQEHSITGVETAYGQHAEDTESKGVKAHFRVDDSGVLSMEKAEFVFERAGGAADTGADESTLSKIGNFFFGGSDDKEGKIEEPTEDPPTPEAEEPKTEEEKADKEEKAAEPETEEMEKSETEKSETETETEGDKPAEEVPAEDKKEEEKKEEETKEEETKEEETKEEEKKEEEATEEKKTEETEEAPKDKEDEPKKEEEKTDEKKEGEEKKEEKKDGEKEKKKEEEKKKKAVIKELLLSESKAIDLADPTDDVIKAAKEKIKSLKQIDLEKQNLAMAMNDLESFIVNTQDKLYQEDYEKCSTEENREELRAVLSEAGDWMYEQEDDAPRKTYEDKLKEVKAPFKDLIERVAELQRRPQAVEAFKSVMNYSLSFQNSMKNMTGEDMPFTQVEYVTLETLIVAAKEWNETTTALQAEKPLHEKAVLLSEDYAKHIRDLDREVKYLLNKLKMWKPKVPKVKVNPVNKTKEEAATEEGEKVIDPESTGDSEDVKIEDSETEESSEEIKIEETAEEEETLQLGDGAETIEDILPETEEVKDEL